MPATYVIGDIHGALKALQQLLTRLELKNDDQLIFLGDYVNGWSDSVAVITHLMALSQQYSCIFIKGNHDDWCESWLKGTLPPNSTLKNGRIATMASYNELSAEERAQHAAFFAAMKDYYVDDKNRLFIHAGYTVTPGTVPFDHAMYKDRTLWEMALTMDKRVITHPELYPKILQQFHEIYIGHTPTLIYGETMPMKACNVYNLDTGAAYLGRVSAMNPDTGEVWQSDLVMELYPNEKGRNA
ncbi:MAG: serine/threonine protein phosphatase [Chitinophaga sp.]|uniref:metallophosphoesterase family protein n=1 Tax=Chitinophaga sp. TaxID=1869181 RepID=UPI001B23C51E|nr:metallophosphoesterase family protein [Chitinophaga sp.]MBO9727456.1 serine/threonine protein phosphatase [Chitinophaga sp.]